jgi:hypothetical protein
MRRDVPLDDFPDDGKAFAQRRLIPLKGNTGTVRTGDGEGSIKAGHIELMTTFAMISVHEFLIGVG